MTKLVRYAYRKEPAAALAVLNWLAGAVLGLTGHPEFTPVLVAVGLAFLGVRAKVVPVETANETALEAATQAAVTTAKNMTEATAGYAGEVTAGASAVIDDALALVTGLLGAKR